VSEDVHRRLDRRVTEASLDLGGMRALGDEDAGAGVPEVVEANAAVMLACQ
jgi:hypothetical protein